MGEKRTIHGNGIMEEDGQYSVTIGVDDLYEVIKAEHDEPEGQQKTLLKAQAWADQGGGKLGPPPSLAKHANNLAKMRWGVIWPCESQLSADEQAHFSALKKPLAKLIAHRCQQMQTDAPDEFTYKAGWDVAEFLWQQELSLHEFDPKIMPYYLLIVGSPEQVPWEFQYYLDTTYAVGRLWFDEPSDCERYVEHLLAYETDDSDLQTGREVLFVGTQHPGDGATKNSSTRLVQPLYDWLSEHDELKFDATLLLGETVGGGAFKENIVKRLTGYGQANEPKKPPTLLFTAGHGLECKKSSPNQYSKQGALIYQDYPNVLTAPQPSHYLTGNDVTKTYSLEGMMVFGFACYSAGTPLKPDWKRPPLLGGLSEIADRPFVARLPQKMLANGLLAFIGHVSRAWDFSFMGLKQQARKQVGLFSETIGELLRGQPVGHATDWMNTRWPQMTAHLDNWLTTKQRSKAEIADLWLARNDCRGYVIIGDPAARINVKSPK